MSDSGDTRLTLIVHVRRRRRDRRAFVDLRLTVVGIFFSYPIGDGIPGERSLFNDGRRRLNATQSGGSTNEC